MFEQVAFASGKLAVASMVVTLLCGASGCSSASHDVSGTRLTRDSGTADATATPSTSTTPTLFYLDPGHALLGSVGADGSNPRTLVTGQTGIPDGVAVDLGAGHVYWTVMGLPNANDGTIERADLDGSHLFTVVPSGGTFTPKQLKIDHASGKLYWSDREGMRVLRANLDGTNIETLVVTGTTDAERADDTRWCVGIALDPARRQLYWTQKGPYTSAGGTIRRASMDLPAGQAPDSRSDVEVLFSGLVSPVDLDVDLGARRLYWTSNGDMTVSSAPMDPPPGYDPATRADRSVLVQNADQAVGIALDVPHSRLFFAGSFGVDTAHLDGTGRVSVLPMTNELMTGLAFVEMPE